MFPRAAGYARDHMAEGSDEERDRRGATPWIGRSRRRIDPPQEAASETAEPEEEVPDPDAQLPEEPPWRPDLWAEGDSRPHSTVWMVNLKTGLAGRKGILFLDGRILVFRPLSTQFGDTRIGLDHVRQVKAARFTPVLDVRLSAPDLPQRIGFYFVEPPNLEPIESTGIQLTSPRRRARREAASVLREANSMIRDDVDAWVRRIKMAVRRR
jgi:hypothetical protein